MNIDAITPFPPLITLDDFYLRALRTTDAAAWFAYLSDPVVVEWTSYNSSRLLNLAMICSYTHFRTQQAFRPGGTLEFRGETS